MLDVVGLTFSDVMRFGVLSAFKMKTFCCQAPSKVVQSGHTGQHNHHHYYGPYKKVISKEWKK